MLYCTYGKLTSLLGFDSYDDAMRYHKRRVDDYLGNEKNTHDDKWTKSIAVGGKSFVERVKALMGVLAAGRKSIEVEDSYQPKEPVAVYIVNFNGKKDDIGLANACLWNV